MLILKILIVEDDPKLCQLYSIILNKAGYETICADNGQAAWNILEKEHIDLIITAKDDFHSKSKGFGLGSDDYMTKPVDVNEMALRVRALLRRAHILEEKQIQIGETVLNYDAMTIERKGESQLLPQKEFFLLYKLLSYPNKIFTRNQLMDEIWGRDSTSIPQTVDVHINRLRRHFQCNPDFEIVTVRGLGYKAVVR